MRIFLFNFLKDLKIKYKDLSNNGVMGILKEARVFLGKELIFRHDILGFGF